MDEIEHVVLHLLLDNQRPSLWSEQEVALAIGSDMKAAHALVGLHAAGLVHRCHEFVFPTRAAARFNELEGA